MQWRHFSPKNKQADESGKEPKTNLLTASPYFELIQSTKSIMVMG